jgi:hypothetical protein
MIIKPIKKHAVASVTQIVTFVSYVALFGEFHKCSSKDFKEAMIELAVTTVFSTMPLWIMPLIGPLFFRSHHNFLDHVLSTVRGGELFVYCAALVGPLIYIITRRYGDFYRNDDNRFSLTIAFPHGMMFVLIASAICIFAGFAFGLMKNPIFEGKDSGVEFNLSGIFWVSIIVYFISLYCVFSASAYRNALTDFVKDNPLDEDAFSKAFEDRRDAGSAEA